MLASSLTPEQRTRYERNLLVPGIGDAGQARLAVARVLIVGLGGLGSPAALYLAAAGVGVLGLADPDRVELSNLQRQVLHRQSEIRQLKVDSAVRTLSALNAEVRLELHPTFLDGNNAGALLAAYDVVVEATDSFETKYLINDTCVAAGKPFVTAGSLALSGHALFVIPGRTPCLRCVVPEIPLGEPTTVERGVLGAVAGVLGSLEALEVLRWITGINAPAKEDCGRLHGVDGEGMRLTTTHVKRRPDCRCAAGRNEQCTTSHW